ncbi:hypothetical protein [Saccharopolyspora hattusasensis]
MHLAGRLPPSSGTKETLTTAHGRALARSLPRAMFTSGRFSTNEEIATDS